MELSSISGQIKRFITFSVYTTRVVQLLQTSETKNSKSEASKFLQQKIKNLSIIEPKNALVKKTIKPKIQASNDENDYNKYCKQNSTKNEKVNKKRNNNFLKQKKNNS